MEINNLMISGVSSEISVFHSSFLNTMISMHKSLGKTFKVILSGKYWFVVGLMLLCPVFITSSISQIIDKSWIL